MGLSVNSEVRVLAMRPTIVRLRKTLLMSQARNTCLGKRCSIVGSCKTSSIIVLVHHGRILILPSSLTCSIWLSSINSLLCWLTCSSISCSCLSTITIHGGSYDRWLLSICTWSNSIWYAINQIKIRSCRSVNRILLIISTTITILRSVALSKFTTALVLLVVAWVGLIICLVSIVIVLRGTCAALRLIGFGVF